MVRFAPGQRVKYVMDNKSFGAFILSDEMRDITTEVAQKIATTAAELTPVGKGDGPHLRDQFEVRRGAGVLKVGGNLRVMVEVVNEAPHAGAVEFGSRNNRAVRMLGRAGAKHGDFKPEPAPRKFQRGPGGNS